MERIVELNRGPFVGAPEPIRPLNGGAGRARRPARASSRLDMRAARSASPSTAAASPRRRRSPFRRRASSIGTRRGLALSGIFDLAGYLVGPPSEETMPAVDLEGPADGGARSRCSTSASRTSGTRATSGSRNIPYRLVRVGRRPPGRQARGDDLHERFARGRRGERARPQRGSRRDQCSARRRGLGRARRRHRQLSALWFVGKNRPAFGAALRSPASGTRRRRARSFLPT